MFLFLFSTILAQEPCSTPINSQDFLRQLDSIELGFVVADLKKINEGMLHLEQNIPCLNTPLLPEEAARYHIFTGLQAWVSNDKEKMLRSFSVAKKTHPEAKISTHMFPEGHTIHDIYAENESAKYELVVEKISRGKYSFDGHIQKQRPISAPTIMQIVDKQKILYSAYLDTDSPIPKWEKPRTYHKNIAFGASALSFFIGTGLQIGSQVERMAYEKHAANINTSTMSLYELDEKRQQLNKNYDSHKAQYTYSMISYLCSAGFLGLSFALEW